MFLFRSEWRKRFRFVVFSALLWPNASAPSQFINNKQGKKKTSLGSLLFSFKKIVSVMCLHHVSVSRWHIAMSSWLMCVHTHFHHCAILQLLSLLLVIWNQCYASWSRYHDTNGTRSVCRRYSGLLSRHYDVWIQTRTWASSHTDTGQILICTLHALHPSSAFSLCTFTAIQVHYLKAGSRLWQQMERCTTSIT